jgi:hypothetical protein
MQKRFEHTSVVKSQSPLEVHAEAAICCTAPEAVYRLELLAG